MSQQEHYTSTEMAFLLKEEKNENGYLTKEEMEQIDHEVSLVPHKKAAVIEALKIVQQHRGWISNDSVDAIAAYIGMSAEEVDSVATFYNLIFRKPVGKHIILLCDSISCYVMGYKKLYEALQTELKMRKWLENSSRKWVMTQSLQLSDKPL